MHSRYGWRGHFERDTLQLMEAIRAPPGQKDYDAEQFVPLVIDYW